MSDSECVTKIKDGIMQVHLAMFLCALKLWHVICFSVKVCRDLSKMFIWKKKSLFSRGFLSFNSGKHFLKNIFTIIAEKNFLCVSTGIQYCYQFDGQLFGKKVYAPTERRTAFWTGSINSKIIDLKKIFLENPFSCLSAGIRLPTDGRLPPSFVYQPLSGSLELVLQVRKV